MGNYNENNQDDDQLEPHERRFVPVDNGEQNIKNAERKHAEKQRVIEEQEVSRQVRAQMNSMPDGSVVETERTRLAEAKAVRTLKAALREPVVVISVVILCALFFFFRPFLVPSESMVPTFEKGDRIISVAQYFPNGHTYQRGDIICFTVSTGDVYVKRVIGIGGDRIQISGEKVYVNGELSEWQGTGGKQTSMDVQLADDEYWVMGDNRGNSEDSRFIGPIKAKNVISKVYMIYWPFDRAKIL